MADRRSVTLIEVRHVPNLRKNLISIRILDSKGCNFDASGGKMLWGKKTRGLYRLEGNVQTGGATVRHGSSGISKENGQGKQPLHRGMQSKHRGTWGIHNGTWRIRSGTKAQGDALGYVWKSGRGDVEASLFCSRFDQWRLSLQLCTQGRRDGAMTTRKVMYFAAHPGGGCRAPQWGCKAPRLRADCCEVRLRGKTETDCERGSELSDRVSSVVIHSFDSGLVILSVDVGIVG
ncbi:hypothetical protein Acr_04g0004540 [Actinidia rufa]|uniref:Uncharacterized protein n=1 Tax=Actinidia rufa TaxID=165716 RepID=A0A7J0EHQ3_9ERIC|nr:hypothetical protein Acr_04g0004540 [Actinidia rufa]